MLLPQEAKGEVENVGNAQGVTILELARRIKKITRYKSPVTFHPLPKGDPKRRCPDTNKLEALVEWKPQVKFEISFEEQLLGFPQDQVTHRSKRRI